MEQKIDGGYGWTVCAIACWLSASFGMADYGYSIIVGPLTKELKSSLAVISLGGELIPIVQYVFAPLYSLVGSTFGHRRALVVALILAPVSLACSGFVTNTWPFIVTYCILPGFFYGQMNLSAMSVTITYFDKKLDVANGLFKGAQTLGIMVHTMPVNYLALNYDHKLNSIYMMSLFVVCLLLMPFFYPSTKDVDPKQAMGNPRQPVDLVAAVLFYASIIFFWFGFYMTYTLVVEMIEFQSIRKITTNERGLIVLGHALANGSVRIIAPLVTHSFKIPPQLICACFSIINTMVMMAFSMVTDYYALLFLVFLCGVCNAPPSAFDAGIATQLLGPTRRGQALWILYMCMGIGHIPGAPLAGFFYKLFGVYFWSLTGSAVSYFIAACCNILSHLRCQRVAYEKMSSIR